VASSVQPAGRASLAALLAADAAGGALRALNLGYCGRGQPRFGAVMTL
jgi:hypothetical protein